MTDHDRGAYTPQPDTPLQFDARGPRRRKPMPMTLIGSGAVLVVLLGALALHYKHDTTGDGAETRPAAESKATPAPAAAPSTQAASGAGAQAPSKGGGAAVTVFGGAQTAQTASSAPTKPPKFAAPPEAPQKLSQLGQKPTQLKVQTDDGAPLKSAPLPTTASSTSDHLSAAKGPLAKSTVAKPATVAVAKTTPPAPSYHAPPSTPASKPDATAVVDRLADAAPTRAVPIKTPTHVAKLAAAASTTKTSGSVFGGSVVQIGAFLSMNQSEKGWSDVSTAMGSEMSGKMKRVEAVEKEGKTLYRTSVAGFANRAAAEAFCRSLTAKGRVCFAKG